MPNSRSKTSTSTTLRDMRSLLTVALSESFKQKVRDLADCFPKSNRKRSKTSQCSLVFVALDPLSREQQPRTYVVDRDLSRLLMTFLNSRISLEEISESSRSK